jgi:hypothetical protein
MLYGSSKKNRLFGGIYRLHLQGNKTHSFVILKIEAICFSETSVLLIGITWCHISEDNILQQRDCLKMSWFTYLGMTVTYQNLI